MTAETRDAIAEAVSRGSPAGPWSPKLSGDARSIRLMFVEHGVTTADGQKRELAHLVAAGFGVFPFRTVTRTKAIGFRSADGEPKTANWIEESPGEAA